MQEINVFPFFNDNRQSNKILPVGIINTQEGEDPTINMIVFIYDSKIYIQKTVYEKIYKDNEFVRVDDVITYYESDITDIERLSDGLDYCLFDISELKSFHINETDTKNLVFDDEEYSAFIFSENGDWYVDDCFVPDGIENGHTEFIKTNKKGFVEKIKNNL